MQNYSGMKHRPSSRIFSGIPESYARKLTSRVGPYVGLNASAVHQTVKYKKNNKTRRRLKIDRKASTVIIFQRNEIIGKRVRSKNRGKICWRKILRTSEKLLTISGNLQIITILIIIITSCAARWPPQYAPARACQI